MPSHPSAPQPCGRVKLDPFPAPGVFPAQDPRLWGRGRFLLPLVGRKVGSTSTKERDRGSWRGQPRTAWSPIRHQSCLLSQRRHLRSSLRRGTRSSAAPWTTTTVSHALLGNFEVTAPTCQGGRSVLRAPGWAGDGRGRLNLTGSTVWGWADCPQGPGVQWPCHTATIHQWDVSASRYLGDAPGPGSC